jgi:hypothetical protein
MREYRKRKQLEDNCNNVPKRTKLHAEQQCEYRKTHKNLSVEYMHNYRKCKARENKTPQASTSTDCTPTPTIHNYNQATEGCKKKFIGNPSGDACDRLCYMNDLKQIKEKHKIVLAPEF